MLRWLVLLGVVVGCAPAAPVVPAPAAPAPVVVPAVAEPAARLEYLVWTSEPATASTPLPTVVAMHGLGDRPEAFQTFLSNLDGVRVIVPRAPLPWGQGSSWFSQRAMQAEPGVIAQEMVLRAAQVAALVEEVNATYAVTGPVVVTGFSQGGMMSFAMAALYPDRIAGAVPVAGIIPQGVLPPALTAAHRRTPIRALQGTADRVLPLTVAQRGVEAMRSRGFDVTLETFEGVGHAVPPPVRARLEAHVQAMLRADAPPP